MNAGSDDHPIRRLARELPRRCAVDVRTTLHDRMLYATDASIYQVEPLAVVIPHAIDAVREVLAYCHEHRVPIVMRGGGTSLAGQVINRAVVLDCSPHCRNIVQIDASARQVVVEPGVVLDQLNDALVEHGLMFGPDVATSTHATLGGMIGNNSAGARSILFGRTVDNVVGMDVAQADGSVITLDEGAAERDPRVHELTDQVMRIVRRLEPEIDARYPRTRRRVNGYNLDMLLAQLRACRAGAYDRVNLAHLLCGSEGTLGAMTSATLALAPVPKHRGLAVVSFRGIDEALEVVSAILATQPSAVELVDDTIIELALKNREYRRFIDLLPQPGGAIPGAVLYVEYFTDTSDQLTQCFESLGACTPNAEMVRHEDPTAMAGAWKLRKAGEPLLHGRPGARKPATFVEDTAVDPVRLPEFIRRFRAVVEEHGTSAAYFAHASVGCMHIRPMINLKDSDDRRTMEAIAHDVADLVLEFGGALSGEHGDGRLRSHLLERFYGAALCAGFAEIKKVFDPQGLLNPGNIVDPPPMVTDLRVLNNDGELTTVPSVETYFHYDDAHGFGGAVEMCNGAGVCRKTKQGTMCPSYRATLDERHSTRGRGNALRLAITGQLDHTGADGFGDPETQETLDLCLSCKACKSECPSNVDIARLKAEYAAHTHKLNGGAPLNSRMIAHVRTLNQIASLAPAVSNLLGRNPLLRLALEKMTGVDASRTLPSARVSLYRRMRSAPVEASDASAPTVVLLPDCFTVYNEPEVGRSAIHVLRELGYRVVLPKAGCCGRSMISQGMLQLASKTIAKTGAALYESMMTHDACALVGCEPSCISAIVDDWPDLKSDLAPQAIEHLAAHAMTIERFIESNWEMHPRRPDIARHGDGGVVRIHEHCHTKALWDSDTCALLLRRFTCDEVQVEDSGCCGMAGAFGMMRDHRDISHTIADQSLASILEHDPGDTVVMPGTSCRHQFLDLYGRIAVHPIQWIERMLHTTPRH